ncbi:MAG: MFS transporter [Dehalococcoidia bacterium]|jgi:MFS family permease|nr:MAG: MFS transporter [Dehalococcoidia bacterium]
MSPSLKTFSSLKYPAFRLYLGMYVCQMAVMDMRSLAQSLLIYRLTGSVALLGVMALVNAVPGLLLPLFGGVIADRLPKKNMILIAQGGAITSALIVALSLTTGLMSAERPGSWMILLLATFINFAASSLAMPSRQAIIAELVGDDQIMNAVSLRSTAYNILHLGAPAIAGLLIDKIGFEYVYYLNTALSITGLVLTLFLPFTGTLERKAGNMFSQMKEGLKYIRGETSILLVIGFTMMTTFLGGSYFKLLPVFVDDILEVGATGMGVLVSISAIGALTSSLVMASIPGRKRGAMLLGAITLLSLSLIGFAVSRNWYLSLGFILMVGLGRSARATLSNTLIQSYTAPGYRGRVMSFYSLEEGVMSLGSFIIALVAVGVGVDRAVGGFAATLLVLTLAGIILLPKIRKME